MAPDCRHAQALAVQPQLFLLPGDMRAGLTIDHGYEISLRHVIDFILAIEYALLLLLQGEWRFWQIDANLSAWADW